jgi:hypothetical protein
VYIYNSYVLRRYQGDFFHFEKNGMSSLKCVELRN